jgi:hypothetical protein
MGKLNPIHEVIKKQIVDERYEFVIVKNESFIVTDKHIMIIQPLKYYNVPVDQIRFIEGKAFSKESFREIQKADTIEFREEGVFCVSKGGKVKKVVYYHQGIDFKVDTLLNLSENLEPANGNGIKPEQYMRLSKSMLTLDESLLEIYKVPNTNLKVVKAPNYEDQIAFIAKKKRR